MENGQTSISLQHFYTFLILPFKVENDVKENSLNVPLLKFLIAMSIVYVHQMKTIASWKKNDPILETRKIALLGS